MLVWDEQGLLGRCGHKPERAKRLIEMFMEDIPDTLSDIKTSLDNNDTEKTHKQAHALKGMAANLGALRLQETAFDLELCANQLSIDRCNKLLKVILLEVDHLKEELQDFMDE